MNRQVVLVDEQDMELGTADVYEAHKGKGLKHRALSVFLYRITKEKTELLLQKRAEGKPVFKSMWGNSCCTNLRPGDEYIARAVSRLDEEMGIKISEDKLRILYKFSYEAPDTVTTGWAENELDTVIVGQWEGDVRLNTEEASDYKWIELTELREDIVKNPEIYTPWLKMIINDPRFVEEVV